MLLLLLGLVRCDEAYFAAVANRALLLVPPKSRDKLSYVVPDFDPGAAVAEFFKNPEHAPYLTQHQPKPFTCKALSDLCPAGGQCLYHALRGVYGKFLGISEQPVSVLQPSLGAAVALTVSASHLFSVGFETDNAGRKSFVQHGTSDLVTLRSYFDSLVFTSALVEALDARTLAIEFARELDRLTRAGDGDAAGALYGSGVQRWLDESSASLCQVYEFYRSPGEFYQNRAELKASLVAGETEKQKFLEIGRSAAVKAVVRVAVMVHFLSNKLASETEGGSKNLAVLGLVLVAGVSAYLATKFWKPENKYK